MYVLSWLSLFIQVAFITLAVGERRDLAPRGSRSGFCARRGSHHEALGRPARPRPALPPSQPSCPAWSCFSWPQQPS